jgi:hypothetical protein
MYFSLTLVLLGESLLLKSWRMLGYASVVFLGVHVFVVLYEEPRMGKKWGTALSAILPTGTTLDPECSPAPNAACVAVRASLQPARPLGVPLRPPNGRLPGSRGSSGI